MNQRQLDFWIIIRPRYILYSRALNKPFYLPSPGLTNALQSQLSDGHAIQAASANGEVHEHLVLRDFDDFHPVFEHQEKRTADLKSSVPALSVFGVQDKTHRPTRRGRNTL